jgi:hypothetical protein
MIGRSPNGVVMWGFVLRPLIGYSLYSTANVQLYDMVSPFIRVHFDGMGTSPREVETCLLYNFPSPATPQTQPNSPHLFPTNIFSPHISLPYLSSTISHLHPLSLAFLLSNGS